MRLRLPGTVVPSAVHYEAWAAFRGCVDYFFRVTVWFEEFALRVWWIAFFCPVLLGQSVVQPGAPGMPSRRLPANTAAVAPQTSAADIAFMQGMVMHHGQAVTMTGLIEARTTNPEVRRLGARISRSQADEIRFMRRWLRARGAPLSMAMPGMPDMDTSGQPMPAMPGMLTDEQMAALKAAQGPPFDHKFLTGMMQHHNGALVMVKALFATPGAGQDAELFDFATDVDNTQRAEIKIMETMLKEKE
jgi:uncharacterized protein (DUF305 family)